MSLNLRKKIARLFLLPKRKHYQKFMLKIRIRLSIFFSSIFTQSVKYDSLDFQRKILDEVTNLNVYVDSKYFYWVSFPKKDN